MQPLAQSLIGSPGTLVLSSRGRKEMGVPKKWALRQFLSRFF